VTLPVAIAIMVSLLAPLASADDIRTYVGLSAGWSGLGEVPIKNDALGTVAVAFAKGGGGLGAEAGFDSGVIRPRFGSTTVTTGSRASSTAVSSACRWGRPTTSI
jgi:hypothetical protein